MARGSKAKYTDKQKREAEHIEEGYEDRGVGKKEAERRAWATVNKESGAKKSGSGRGKKKKTASAKKGGKKAAKKRGKKKKASRKKGGRKKGGRKKKKAS